MIDFIRIDSLSPKSEDLSLEHDYISIIESRKGTCDCVSLFPKESGKN